MNPKKHHFSNIFPRNDVWHPFRHIFDGALSQVLSDPKSRQALEVGKNFGATTLGQLLHSLDSFQETMDFRRFPHGQVFPPVNVANVSWCEGRSTTRKAKKAYKIARWACFGVGDGDWIAAHLHTCWADVTPMLSMLASCELLLLSLWLFKYESRMKIFEHQLLRC